MTTTEIKDSRREQVAQKRQEYMDHKITHQEYYEWFGKEIGFKPSMLRIPLDEVRNSQDPHLNDIPLTLWDNHNDQVRHLIGFYAGGISWSLGDTVCLTKVMARKFLGESNECT